MPAPTATKRIIDTSERRLFKACRRKWDLTAHSRQALRRKLPSPPLLFGTLIHAALDAGYCVQPYDYSRMEWHFTRECTQEIERIRTQQKPWPEEMERYEGLHTLGQAMLIEYAAWASERDDFTMLDTEVSVTIPLRRTPRSRTILGHYFARFDGLAEDNRGRAWVVEHKTCQRWWDEAMLQLDEQITAYTWAAQQHYQRPIAGVLLNFLKKQAVEDPPLLKHGAPTTALARLGKTTASRYADFAGDPPWAPDVLDTYRRLQEREREEGHPTLRRVLVYRTPEQVAAQGERIVQEYQEMTRAQVAIYPSPSLLCRTCTVLDLCQLMEAGDDWRTTAKLLYDVDPTPIWENDPEGPGEETN